MATLKDIAVKTGLSVPTVSRILNPRNGHIPAKQETIQKVKQVAKNLNYTPNAQARSLATSRTDNIALICDTLRDTPEENVFWSRVTSGILRESKNKNIGCFVGLENYSDISEFEIPIGIRERKVDGFIITHPLGNTDAKVLEKFLEYGLPFVVISSVSTNPQIWSVCCDPTLGYQQACRHLSLLGHKKIGYSIYPQWEAMEDRQKMMPAPINTGNIKLDFVPIEIDTSRFTHKQIAKTIAEDIISGKLNVSAIVTGDIISMHLIDFLAEKDIQIPRDISLIGMDDIYMCQFTKPKLSSLRSPLEEMGAAAVDLLLENIRISSESPTPCARHLTLPKVFVERDSTAPLIELQK
ncbi:MAG: LacI family DNA-binding transcriptional regulator [Sedimentisphaeraceae bacterium JB056]